MKKEKGITLIALVVTIVVLIILAGVSISMLTGENGIVNQASEAKEENEISTEKEMVNLSYNACRTQNNYQGLVTSDKMQEELDNLAGDGKTTVEADGENLVIEFTDSKRVYTINQNGEISEGGGIEKVEDSIPGILDGDGSQSNPYKISSIEDLVAFKKSVNGGNTYENQYIILDTDLSFTSDSSYVDPTRTDMGDINGDGKTEQLKTELTTGLGFGTIGLANNFSIIEDDSQVQTFAGDFDGKNHKLKNYIIDGTLQENSYSGLFAENQGTIKDFIMENANLINVNNSMGTTLLCVINNGTIENCKLTGKINLENIINIFGGICVDNLETISKCENQANIHATGNSGTLIVAGICAYNENIITLSSNIGNITVTQQLQESQIETMATPGTDEGVMVTGISYTNAGTIEFCYNTGSLEGIGKKSSLLTGIAINVQWNANTIAGKIYNCYNTGNLKSECLYEGWEFTGSGFAGISMCSLEISNCYNTGKFETENETKVEVEDGINKCDSVTNYYYLENILPQEIDSITEMTEQDMKSDNFVNTLNTNAEQLGKEGRFIRDDNQNNGYPIIEK